MADGGAFSAGKDGRHLASERNKGRVADRIYALIEAMETMPSHTRCDRARADTGCEKLAGRHHPVLPLGERRDHPIAPGSRGTEPTGVRNQAHFSGVDRFPPIRANITHNPHHPFPSTKPVDLSTG